MITRALTYVYVVLGTAFAALMIWGTEQRVDELTDDTETSDRVARERVEDDHGRDGSYSPTDAAQYRAQQLTTQPLRTIGLVLVYMFVFGSIGVLLAFPELQVPFVDVVIRPFLDSLRSALPLGESTTSLLAPAGIVIGVFFAVIVHQSVKTAEDIQ